MAFADIFERDAAWEFLSRHLIRRWHGREQAIRFVGEDGEVTRYDGPLRAPNLLVCYREPHCRITGELHVVHLEWRCNGVGAVRAAGISKPGDLLTFPFRSFWRHRLLLVDITDKERLGRLYRNAGRKTKDRRPRIHRNGINLDVRLGQILLEGHTTIQEVVDHARGAGIGRILVKLDNHAFLPPRDAPSLICNYQTGSSLDEQHLVVTGQFQPSQTPTYLNTSLNTALVKTALLERH